MAIAAGDVVFWRELVAKSALPIDPRILEIGECNWYGDVDPTTVAEIARGGGSPGDDDWETAKAFYRGLLGPGTTFEAIDLNGTAAARPLDLNEPVPLYLFDPFDLVVNSGTTEHVFDQRQVFQTIHDLTRTGGVMVHCAPLSGWPDHGFYNYHPGLFRDLAAANGYELLHEQGWSYSTNRDPDLCGTTMPVADLMLTLALRKTRRDPFRVPIQGRYRA